ncbi:DUF6438 domain-containing protein [Flavobacterium sp.]|uniref:DUF6438 domain-containing protein n=1 Tax=Flavobacterium sp. TaxID=239 RepID=UPI0039E4EAC4
MKKYLALSLIAVSLFSCKSAKDQFQFEKIAFSSSMCFGFCPSYQMEINNDRSVRMHGDSVFGKRFENANIDRSKTGYFTGTVADTTYNKLLKELRTIGLDTVKFGGPDCCDGSIKTIVVYYNGKRKFLKAMFPPEHAHALIATLQDIYSTTPFVPTTQKFEIERDSIRK